MLNSNLNRCLGGLQTMNKKKNQQISVVQLTMNNTGCVYNMYGNKSAVTEAYFNYESTVLYEVVRHWKKKVVSRLSRISLERSVGLEKPPRECLATCQRENTNELPGNEAILIVNVNQLMKDTTVHAAASHIHRSWNPHQDKSRAFSSIVQIKTRFDTVHHKLCCRNVLHYNKCLHWFSAQNVRISWYP